MGGKRSSRITKKDIAKAESLPALIGQLVKSAKDGNAEDKEGAVCALRSIATQNQENAELLFKAGAVKPLVELLRSGSNDAQVNAAGTLQAIATRKPDHQAAIVSAGGIEPLVKLLRMGSCKVQEVVRLRRSNHSAVRTAPLTRPCMTHCLCVCVPVCSLRNAGHRSARRARF